MSLQKIGELKPPCNHPEHNPPSHMVLSPGIYRHICPSCGEGVEFVVCGPSWNMEPKP